MANSADSKRLLSGFLIEAWEGLAGLEQSVTGLATAHAEAAVQKLTLLGHRLNGSAALYGFPQLASLAEHLEAAAHQIDATAPEQSPKELAAFDATLRLMPEILDRIAEQGNDDHPAIASLLEQYAGLRLPTSQTPSGQETASPSPASLRRFGGVDRELGDFRRQHPDVLDYYLPEAEEHLEGITNSLSRLEADPRQAASISELFRSVHTLKGAAFTVGCEPMGKLAHNMEDLMVEIREDRSELDAAAIQALNAASDVLRASLNSLRGADAALETDYETAAKSLLAWLGAAAETTVAKPDQGVLDEPVGRPAVNLSAPERSADLAEPPQVATASPNPARSVIRVNLDRMDRLLNLVGELVIARRRFERELDHLEEVDEQMIISRSRMVDAVQDFEDKYLNPGFDPSQTKSKSHDASNRGADPATDELSLSQAPLDELFEELEFDRYDDFNILSRRVGEISADLREAQTEIQERIQILRREARQLRQLTLDLRDGISRARMVPIGQLFGRFRRLLRKLETDSGKEVQLVTIGETVEVDNAIMERIVDPLMHLVQNAVTHGIESPERRRDRGKPPQGSIVLTAYPRGNFVYLEVEDDGRGIDVEKLKRLAAAQGFRSQEELAALDDQQALHLIYLPGLSTSTELTTAAGRGVGMDVVLNNISGLNGEIGIETETGVGTRFTLKLPLTLLISEALIVGLGDLRFGIPAPAILRLLHAREEALEHTDSGDLIRIGEETIEVLWLEQVFGVPSRRERSDEIPFVLIQGGGRSFALAVDELMGIEEIVIKRLGRFLEGLELFAGATISGEGSVIPLLDTLAFGALGGRAMWPSKPKARPAASELPEVRPVVQSGGILLVDDSLSVRKIVGGMLETAGLTVTTASDGAEAIEAIREQTFDLVLTDLEMPRLNGYELIEHLRRLPATRSLPIVVITSRAGTKHFELAQRLGATEYLTKPIDQENLIHRLKALLTTTEASTPTSLGSLEP